MKERYNCVVYSYNAYARYIVDQASVEDLPAYISNLNLQTPDWDELELRTEPGVSILYGEDDSKFLGKVFNPKSKYLMFPKG